MPKYDPNAVLECLKRCKIELSCAKRFTAFGQLNAKIIKNVDKLSTEHMARAAFSKEFESISEDLQWMKKMRSESKFPQLFRDEKTIKSHRNILAHEFGKGKIQWEPVMKVVNTKFPKLESAVDEAIRKLESSKKK